VEALLADEAVRAHIAQDSILDASAADPALRARMVESTRMLSGMASLLELVGALLSDDVIRSRIQTDPALRRLWSEEAVRTHVQPPPHDP
jgi:hypothetical protein